jgi:hypothetical protein
MALVAPLAESAVAAERIRRLCAGASEHDPVCINKACDTMKSLRTCPSSTGCYAFNDYKASGIDRKSKVAV